MNSPFYKLMLVTHRQGMSLESYLAWIKTCALAGITSVQLRDKQQTREFLLEFGLELKRILDPLDIPLIVNDDVELALQLDASGVHLGQTDGDVTIARERLGPNKIIGVSIDSKDNLIDANQLPIDYVGIGAIYKTKNKKNIATIWGLRGLQQIAPHSKHPIIGIGGVNVSNAADVLSAGAHGIAVIGAIHDAKDPSLVTQQLRRIIGDHKHVV